MMALIQKRRAQRAAAKARFAALRVEYSILSRLAPDTAARKAARLWCTMPNNHGRRKDTRPYPGTLSQVRDSAGRRLAVESWGEGPLVYLVHGWGSWRGQLGSFVDPLVQAGFQVVGFDCLSHGDSEAGEWGPGASTGGEMVASFRAVAEQWGPAAGVVAHSLGCASATLVLRDGLECKRLAMVSPVQNLVVPLEQFATALWLSERTRRALPGIVSQMAKTPVEDFDIAPHAHALPPGILIHDTHDKETPYAASGRIAEAWPNGVMVTTEFLGHQRILNDAAVIDRVVQSLSRQDVRPTGC